MSQRTRQRRNQGLMLMLHERTLHPELFKIIAAEQVDRRYYEADVWLVEGGHVVRFTTTEAGAALTGQKPGQTLTEVVLMNGDPVDDRDLVANLNCRGERYHEYVAGGNVKYMVHTQEEQLSRTLFDATRQEMLDHAEKHELMVGETTTDPAYGEGTVTSILDIERRAHELHLHSFHFFEDSLTVVKTQAFMEVLKKLATNDASSEAAA